LSRQFFKRSLFAAVDTILCAIFPVPLTKHETA